MRFCKHQPYRVFEVWQPKWSTKEVLLNVNKYSDNIEHYLVKFTKTPSMEGWYYVDRKTLKKCKTQKNGNGEMFILPLSKLEDFTPINKCEHQL